MATATANKPSCAGRLFANPPSLLIVRPSLITSLGSATSSCPITFSVLGLTK